MNSNNFLSQLPSKSELIRNSDRETLFLINSCLTSDFHEKRSLNFLLSRRIKGEDASEISLIKDQIV